MKCENCRLEIRRPRRRVFPRLKGEYLICDSCNKAQRIRSSIKASSRGTRAKQREQLRTKLALAAARIRIKTLVWGPGSGSGSPARLKREEIKRELKKEGHKAYFSEDLAIGDLPTNVLEMVQLKIVDLVIVVAASFGSTAEFEAFAVTLGPKLLAWFPYGAAGGFIDTGSRRLFYAAGGFDETFRDDDLISCVVTLASVDWVKEKRFL